MSDSFVLPEGLPKPIADDLDAPYWEAAARGEPFNAATRAALAVDGGISLPPLLLLRPRLRAGSGRGALLQLAARASSGPSGPRCARPYVVVLVELPEADGIRMIGNLVDPPEAEIPIGARSSPSSSTIRAIRRTR